MRPCNAIAIARSSTQVPVASRDIRRVDYNMQFGCHFCCD